MTMTTRRRRPGEIWLGLLLLLAVQLVRPPAFATNSASRPVPRDPQGVPPAPDWLPRHEQFVQQARAGGFDLLFLGDSITDFWRDATFWDPQFPVVAGRAVWDANFGSLRAANFGIGADRTQHLLWRLQHGELDGPSPRVIVLLIGTNNLGFERNHPTQPRNSAAEDLGAITDIVRLIRTRHPTTRILLMGLFPRSTPDDPIRGQIREVNAGLAALSERDVVTFLDLGKRFLRPNGCVDRDLLPDLLHPSAAGYAIWAAAIRQYLAKLPPEFQPRMSLPPSTVSVVPVTNSAKSESK